MNQQAEAGGCSALRFAALGAFRRQLDVSREQSCEQRRLAFSA